MRDFANLFWGISIANMAPINSAWIEDQSYYQCEQRNIWECPYYDLNFPIAQHWQWLCCDDASSCCGNRPCFYNPNHNHNINAGNNNIMGLRAPILIAKGDYIQHKGLVKSYMHNINWFKPVPKHFGKVAFEE